MLSLIALNVPLLCVLQETLGSDDEFDLNFFVSISAAQFGLVEWMSWTAGLLDRDGSCTPHTEYWLDLLTTTKPRKIQQFIQQPTLLYTYRYKVYLLTCIR